MQNTWISKRKRIIDVKSLVSIYKVFIIDLIETIYSELDSLTESVDSKYEKIIFGKSAYQLPECYHPSDSHVLKDKHMRFGKFHIYLDDEILDDEIVVKGTPKGDLAIIIRNLDQIYEDFK